MYHYNVAGIGIRITWEKEIEKNKRYGYHDCMVLPRILAAFRSEENNGKTDMAVFVRGSKKYSGPKANKMIYNQAYYEENDRLNLTLYDPYRIKIPGCTISTSSDYSVVVFTPHIKEYEHYDLQWMMFPFEGRVLYKGGIVLHGAAVEYRQKGFIFAGISGSGKSTQANLWQKHRNALILNGDCPAVRIIDGMPIMFGTPWCGTSGQAINRQVPLSYVVLLKKGENNTLIELNETEAYLALLSNVLRSNFDTKSLDLSIENLKSLIGHIRVFEYTCTKGPEAVDILEKKLF